MPKFEKGILGYKKDPKKQVLFSFNVRQGEECPSSDSDDSDYNPGVALDESDDSNDGNDPPFKPDPTFSSRSNQKRQTQRSKSCLKRKANESSKNKKRDLQSQDLPASYMYLPPELWLQIFQYVVEQDGALPFLCRAAEVCTSWREIAAHPSLWERVDLSYGWIKCTDETLQWLCDNRLSSCVDINLSAWKLLKSGDIKNLSEKCPHLRSVNLSYCSKLKSDAVQALADNCKELEDLDLSFTSDKGGNTKTSLTSPSSLMYLMSTRGPQLLELNLSGNMLNSFDRVFSSLLSFCPNLELLDISTCRFSVDRSTFVLPLEKFQNRCPVIRVLSLADCNCRMDQTKLTILEDPDYRGFSKLEQLSLASTVFNTAGLYSDSSFLSIVLSKSKALHLIDLRGCHRMDLSVLLGIPATDVEQLYLSRCSIDASTHLAPLLSKWCHSLTEVDLSWMKIINEDHFDESLCGLVRVLPSKIESLDLAGTPVTEKAIKRLLSNCKNLRVINLTSCRSLSRGIKRLYIDKEIIQLKRVIS